MEHCPLWHHISPSVLARIRAYMRADTCFSCPCPTAPQVAPSVTSQASGNTFRLNLVLADARTAGMMCLQQGGHLASYSSLAEQAEVEGFYVQRGYLLPGFHKFYWMSLTSDYMMYPAFRW
jgi:hypothetical protein